MEVSELLTQVASDDIELVVGEVKNVESSSRAALSVADLQLVYTHITHVTAHICNNHEPTKMMCGRVNSPSEQYASEKDVHVA